MVSFFVMRNYISMGTLPIFSGGPLMALDFLVLTKFTVKSVTLLRAFILPQEA